MYFSSFMFPATVSMNSIASGMICEAQKEKEVNMDKSTVPCFTRERDALRSAMWSASHTKDQALQKHFGIVDDRPTTPKGVVEAITAGKFTYVDEETCDDIGEWDGWMNPLRGLRFTAVKEDKAGYKKAAEVMRVARDALEIDIAVMEPKEGLAALRKFEGHKFH